MITSSELAKQLSEMKWGDSLSKLFITANEAHELGEAFVKLEAELEQLRQQVKAPADDGWIEWAGGECPVPANALVEVRYKSGGEGPASRAAAYDWSHNMEGCYPIGAYRVVKP